MSRATIPELLIRRINKLLTAEEYNDPIRRECLIQVFFFGAQADRRIKDNEKQREQRERRAKKRETNAKF